AHETWREGTESIPIRFLARETDDRGRAAVEVAVRHDDFGAVGGNALDAIAPAAGALDGGFHSFGARVHRAGGVEARDLTKLLHERAELVAVICARGHGKLPCLSRQGVHDARVRMPVTHCRIGTHHV